MMIRLRPDVRAALAELAAEDSRSMAGELEWLIRQEARRRERRSPDSTEAD